MFLLLFFRVHWMNWMTAHVESDQCACVHVKAARMSTTENEQFSHSLTHLLTLSTLYRCNRNQCESICFECSTHWGRWPHWHSLHVSCVCVCVFFHCILYRFWFTEWPNLYNSIHSLTIQLIDKIIEACRDGPVSWGDFVKIARQTQKMRKKAEKVIFCGCHGLVLLCLWCANEQKKTHHLLLTNRKDATAWCSAVEWRRQ